MFLFGEGVVIWTVRIWENEPTLILQAAHSPSQDNFQPVKQYDLLIWSRGTNDKISIYVCITHSFDSVCDWSYRPTQWNWFEWPLDHLRRIFVVFVNRRCLFIFYTYRIRRKVTELSSICLFLVTHLNHELTWAAYELRVRLTLAHSV